MLIALFLLKVQLQDFKLSATSIIPVAVLEIVGGMIWFKEEVMSRQKWTALHAVSVSIINFCLGE